MAGFFTKEETQSDEFHKGKRIGCHRCTLYSESREVSVGNFKKGILNVFEYAEGGITKWLKSEEGRSVASIYDSFGVDIVEDCLNICAVACANAFKQITEKEIINCRKTVFKLVKERQPKLINVFGSVSMRSIIGSRFSGAVGEFAKWQGWVIPDQDFKCWVAFIWAPHHIKVSNSSAVDNIWKRDIRVALSHVDKAWLRDKKPNIEIIEDLSVLANIKSRLVSVDYETTGIKPHAPGHRVICASVADTPDHCFAFMMPTSKRGRIRFLNLMWSEHIQKMAHNLKFEEAWTVNRLRQPVRGWYWDSMLAAHILDNRPGVTGLKFQTYVNFGIVDYSSEISPYLQSEGKSANELNTINELVDTFGGREKLLRYCGNDTIYQYRLALKQMELMKYDDLPF